MQEGMMARPAFSVGGVKDAINDSFSRMRRGWESLDMDAKGSIFAIIVFLGLSVLAVHFGPSRSNLMKTGDIDTGDTAWLLASTALVLLMTPGLAFFYGGMVHKGSILYTMFQSISAMAFVTAIWTFVGFSVAFGDSLGGFMGNPATFFMYRNVGFNPDPNLAPTIPLGLFSIFQLKFAIISPGLVSGAFTERIAFLPYCIYMLLFCLLVYCPLAHSVWHPDGYFRQWGVLDFAGGTVVESATGYSALAGGIIFNQAIRQGGHANDPVKRHPHIPYVVLGTALLWFGWFGFNSGSALKADGLAMQSFLNTNVAAAAGMITWMLMDKVKGLKPSVTGACVGAVVGMVVITPACGYVSTGGAFICGIVGGLFCNIMASVLMRSNHVHDQLDVFAAHGLGGTIGMILTGCLADANVNPSGSWGLFYSGHEGVFAKNLVAAVVAAAYSFIMSYLIFRFIGLFLELHVEADAKQIGLDITVHGETVVCFDDQDGNHVQFHLHKKNSGSVGQRLSAYAEEGEEDLLEDGLPYESKRDVEMVVQPDGRKKAVERRRTHDNDHDSVE